MWLLFMVLIALSLCNPALAQLDRPGQVEATTAITLPVDSVTIYPDGLVSVRGAGMMEVPEGQHKFVLDLPESADQKSLNLWATNATLERVVYGTNPTYTLNFSIGGAQSFRVTYLMYNAGSWEPRYTLAPAR